MEQGIQIHYFAHYFVLIIGFTFAYGGLKGFKDYINKVALSKGKFDLSYKVRINGLKDKLTLLKGATITQLIQAKIDKADVLLSELLENEDLAERIYDGRSFQSMFFLTGVIYLSLLIVGGFHQPQLNKPFYLLITTITIGANIYFIKVLLVIRQEAKGEFSHKHSDWRNSFKVIRFYAIGFVIGIIVWVLAAPFIPNPHFCNQHFKLLDYYDFSKGKLFKDFLMLFVMAIPLIPYWRYYYRDEILAHYQSRFDLKIAELEGLCQDGEIISNQQEIIEKKDKPNGISESNGNITKHP